MRLYVTGGTGFVGSNIVKVAVERYGAEVFTTTHSWQASGPVNFEYGPVDMCDPNQVLDSVRAFRPDAIIHSAILSDFGAMYRDRQLAWQSFVEAIRYLTEAANELNAKIILISSDWVFDGTQNNADEYTPPNPVNYYGLLKVVGETIVQESAINGAVARVSGVNGMHWTRPDDERRQNVGLGDFCTAVVDTLTRGETFNVWEGNINMVATPSLASESADMVMRIIQRDEQGIFHCCAGQSSSRMELALATAQVFELDSSLIQPTDPIWGDMAGIPIPYNTSLSADYTAEQLDYELPSIRRLLESYRHQLETGTL